MGIIAWAVFGALAGWVASMLYGNNRSQGWIGNIVIGVTGALIGGFLWSLIDDDGGSIQWSIGSFVIAVAGSILLLFIKNFFDRRSA